MPPSVQPGYRILVVDDGPLNRKLMSGLLSQLGCVVDTASSGEAAIARFAEVTYDVVFVDLHMPGMDGRETVARLRAAGHGLSTPPPRVVVLTADDAPPTGDEGWFDLFLSKPITSALLRFSFDVLASHEPETILAAEPAVDLIDEFLDVTSEALVRMRECLATGDFLAIARAAHGVKGTGTSFGFRVMSVLGARLERDARAESRSDVERGLLELEQALVLA